MELRDRLQPLLINHVHDACMPKDTAGLVVQYLHLPYDVANFKNISQDDMNKLHRIGATPNAAFEENNAKTKTDKNKPGLTQPLPQVSMDAKQSNVDIVTAQLGKRFTVQKMKEECKRRGLHGYSALTRNPLIDFLASDIDARASRAKRNGNQIYNPKSKKGRRS